MSKYLSRDDILQTQGIRTDEVEVPEWGGKVLVRELSATEVTQIGFAMADEKDTKVKVDLAKLGEYIPHILAWCIVDENLDSVFDLDSIRRLASKSIAPVQRIIAKIMDLSNLSPDEEEEGEPEKN